jgi:hypothetical protein
MFKEIGSANFNVHDGFQPREKMSTMRRLEQLNAMAQANALPVARQRKRRTDSQIIKHWAAHGTWQSRFYLA